MPTITANDDTDWIAEEVIRESAARRAMQGHGMQMKLDARTLDTLSNLRPGDTLNLTYSVDTQEGGLPATKLEAVMTVALSDPHGLFAGHSVIAVLGNLLSQIVEHRLAGEAEPWLPNDERTP